MNPVRLCRRGAVVTALAGVIALGGFSVAAQEPNAEGPSGEEPPPKKAPAVKNVTPAKPSARAPAPAVAEAFAPIRWPAPGDADPGCRRLEAAARDLSEIRASLLSLLEQRIESDALRAPPVDVLLDLNEALLFYSTVKTRPRPGVAPQWRDAEGKSLDRIWNNKEEFAPIREDALISFHRRGTTWLGPQIGMLSSKFKAHFHLLGCDASALQAGEAGVGGGFTWTTVRGDFRYDLLFSGESASCSIPEFKQWKDYEGGACWPDWWGGPRERMHPWPQSFKIDAGRRRGWILNAVLVAPAELRRGSLAVDIDLYAWIEDGRILRGYALVPGKLPGRGPELALGLNAWSAKEKTLEAEFVAGGRGDKRTYRLRGRLPEAASGRLAGTFSVEGEKGAIEGELEGTLYRAFAGAYVTEGLDGRWTGDVLAGVASAPGPKPRLPAGAIEANAQPASLFANGVEVYRHVAALDWALREYPLPLARALRDVRFGTDERHDYWLANLTFYRKSAGKDSPPMAQASMHEALAAGLGAGAQGPAEYLEGLARIARATLADRRAGATPSVGLSRAVDQDFGPYRPAGMLERDKARGNLLPARGGNDGAEWRQVGDWTCFGFIQRTYAFETIPYLPEILVERGRGTTNAPLEIGPPVRVPHPDPSEHLWCWRADPAPADGLVTIPRACLIASKTNEPRGRWGGGSGTGIAGETLDFYYHHLATWYAATTVHAERAARAWMAAKIDWDGRVWVNDVLVWRPARVHTPNRVAVFPVDLKAGANRVTVCCSARPVEDGNSGNLGAFVFKYGERAFGSFAVWLCPNGEPRKGESVAAEKERATDTERAAAAKARGIRGRRGDGSGRYPDAKPALAWDLEKGINVRWKAALPTDDAEPVLVGKRLLVTTFTGEFACLDALTGAERWRKKPVVEGAEAEPAPYPPMAVSIEDRSTRLWPQLGPAYAPIGKKPPADSKTVDHVKPHAAYARYCLTPLADARLAWMHDPRGRLACFDHEGRQLWARAVPAQTPRFVEGGYVATRLLPPTSPAILGSRLVAAVGEGLAAFDIEKGTPIWQRPKLDYLGQFGVMDLGEGPNRQLVILSSGEVLDAASGQTLIPRCAPLIPDSACQPVIEGRMTYLHAASSAVRFWIDDHGRLCHRVTWDSPRDIRKRQCDMNHGHEGGPGAPDFFSYSGFPPTPVLHHGLLFTHLAEPCSISHGPQNSTRLQVYDASTGCGVAQRYCILINRMRPIAATVMAGGLIFAGDEGGKIQAGYPDHPMGFPLIAVTTADEEPRRLASSRGLASMAPPVFDGRKMYLAGSEQVVCIERPEELGDTLSEYEVEALRSTFYAKEIGEKPATQADLVVLPPVDALPADLRTPVSPFLIDGFPPRLVGAWPLPDQSVQDPYAAMTGHRGTVVGEGVTISLGGSKAEFRPVPDKALVADKEVTDFLTFNLRVGTWPRRGIVTSFKLSPDALFKDQGPARGFFFAVLANRRHVTVQLACPDGIRCWISGREIQKGAFLRLTPGLYPFLMECRVTAGTAKAFIAPTFEEFPMATRALGKYPADYNPALEMERWLLRVRRNEALLRAIAASGPTGAYARDALDALARAEKGPAGKP
jgi:hypothetical protein